MPRYHRVIVLVSVSCRPFHILLVNRASPIVSGQHTHQKLRSYIYCFTPCFPCAVDLDAKLTLLLYL